MKTITIKVTDKSHRHIQMIAAKAADMGLVVFQTRATVKEIRWHMKPLNCIPSNPNFDYFLCLPQHKEECLHWLNGGSVQNFNGCWADCEDFNIPFHITHCLDSLFMYEEREIRIKPKKVKRWIGVSDDGYTTAHYSCLEDAIEASVVVAVCDWQFIEIEMEDK